jgi:hypothetical protein
MSETKKPRGRPKKPETIERERLEAEFKERPRDPELLKNNGLTINIDLEQAKNIQKELLADFPPTVPHELIYAANSHYEDSEEEQKIQELLDTALARVEPGRLKGTFETRQNAISQAKKLWTKNADLIPKMQKVGHADMTAKKIIKEWDTRGIGGKPPSVNTIKNWFKSFMKK